jgi:hypothetical protein
MRRQDRIQRAVSGVGGSLLAGAPVPARTLQIDVAEGGSKAQRVIALEDPKPMTTGVSPMAIELSCELLPNQLLLQATEDRFRLVQPQTHVLDPLARAFNRLDRDAEWKSVWGFDQYLDCEFRREPPHTNRLPVWPARD